MKNYYLFIIIIFCCFPRLYFAFDTDEMQMFDLIEEVNMSFYVFLGVERKATGTEIRKAYHKLSLFMHPDKNPDKPNAEQEFRQLTAIYGILKDDTMREKYNNVLDNGLPDWRQPLFYYRKLRKMDSLELCIVSSLIAICIHYACIWGIAYENRWTKMEQLGQFYKRHKLSGKKRDDLDQKIKEELDKHTNLPGIWDILPFAAIRWIKNFILYVPIAFKEILNLLKVQQEEYKKKEDNKKLIDRQKKLEKRKLKDKDSHVVSCLPKNIRTETLIEIQSKIPDIEAPFLNKNTTNDSSESGNENQDWFEDDIKLLISCINKIPSGTPNRWGKISKKVGRSERNVIKKAEQLKELSNLAIKREEFRNKMTAEALIAGDISAFTSGFEINEENTCNSEDNESNEEASHFYSKKHSNKVKTLENKVATVDYDASRGVATTNEEEDEDGFVKLGVEDEDLHVSRKKLRQKKFEESSNQHAPPDGDDWTQAQQRMLETAMKSVPKGVPERWDRISEYVDGKSKDEVIARAKFLVQKCKKPDEKCL